MSIVKTATIILEVLGERNILVTVPASPLKAYANETMSISVGVESINEYAGECVCSVAGFPDGSVVDIRPDDRAIVAPGFNIGFQIDALMPANVVPGTYNVIITITAADPS